MTTSRSSHASPGDSVPGNNTSPASFQPIADSARWLQTSGTATLSILLHILVIVSILLPLLVASDVHAAPISADLPAGCFETVVNGGFEQVNANWSIDPSPSPAVFDNVQVFAGNFAMRLGILDGANVAGQSTTSQVIHLPQEANSVILSFRYYGQSDSTNGPGDFQYLDLYDANNNAFLQRRFQVTNSSMMWLGAQYSITDLRGRDVRLVFGVANDGENGRLAMFLDQVSVYFCTTTPTPIVTATPTWTPIPPWTLTPTWTPIWPSPTPVWPTPQPPVWPTFTPLPPVQPTFTPLPPSMGCTDILVNGNMESTGGWEFGQTPLQGGYSTESAVEGGRSAFLGDRGSRPDTSSFSSMRQLVTIPSNAANAQLRWWHFYGSQEVTMDYPAAGTDRQDLILLKSNLDTLAVLSRVRRSDSVWLQEFTDLSQYRGQTIYVYFNAYNNGNNARTWMFIDNVQLCVNVAQPFAAASTTTSSDAVQGASTNVQPAQPTDSAFYAQPTFYYPTAEANNAAPFATPVPPPEGASEFSEDLSGTATLQALLAQPGVTSLSQEQAVEATLTAIAVETLQADTEATATVQSATVEAEATPTSGEGRSRTAAVAVLCGIVLVVGLLAIGIIRVITRSDSNG